MEDTRLVQPDGKAIKRLRRLKLWAQQRLAEEAGVDLDTVKRAEKNERKQMGKMLNIATALEVKPAEIVRDIDHKTVAARDYSWDDMITGARNVAQKIYTGGKLSVDAVLTFPGPSSIFCGLVLAMLPRKVFVGMRVHTAMFLEPDVPHSALGNHYDVITTPRFKLLVPRELAKNESEKILVIDDVIITGGTMEALRAFFAKHHRAVEVRFACCICYEARMLPTEKPPELVGLWPLDQRQKFPMPWGSDSFCFENVYRLPSPRKSG